MGLAEAIFTAYALSAEPPMAMVAAARPITSGMSIFSSKTLGLLLKRPTEPTSDEATAAECEGAASDQATAASSDRHAAMSRKVRSASSAAKSRCANR
jgi:hypothetical protein